MLYADIGYDAQHEVVRIEGVKGGGGIKFLLADTLISTTKGMDHTDVPAVWYNRSMMVPLRHRMELLTPSSSMI